MLFAYETERLLLKIIKPDQADAVLDFYMRDKQAKELFEKFEPDRMPNFYTRQFQRQMLLFEYNMAVQGTLFRFYVYEKEHPERIIGTICVHHITRGFSEQCEVGYKFSSAYHHRGYATESLRFIMDLVFRDLKLHRAMAWALPDNTASIRLLERVGFVYEGICHDYMMLNQKWRDHAQFCMINPD